MGKKPGGKEKLHAVYCPDCDTTVPAEPGASCLCECVIQSGKSSKWDQIRRRRLGLTLKVLVEE